jgi:K+-transporting ATPase KdpF subunit
MRAPFVKEVKGGLMDTIYIIGGVIAALLFAYLVYALIKAEDF